MQRKHPNNFEILELDLLKENSGKTLSDLLLDKPIDILIYNAEVGNSNQNFTWYHQSLVGRT